jgi:hypothetical protein
MYIDISCFQGRLKMLERVVIESELLYLNDDQQGLLGEVSMWRAVIIRALEDLRLPLSNKRYKIWNKQALRWFSETNEDFLIICDYAQLSPHHVLNIAKHYTNSQD